MKITCMTFKRCNICGQIVGVINDSGLPPMCCGEEMETISPKTVETELGEKHIPIFKKESNKLIIQVGQVLHPNTEAHHIEWVALVTNKGHQRKALDPTDLPIITFMLDNDEEPLEIYAYCNIHSLWGLDVKNDSKCL